MRRPASVAVAGLIASLIAGLGLAGWVVGAREAGGPEGLTLLGRPVTAGQIALGQQLYAETCASCHGADLQGQPDWRRRGENGRMPAPPHDADGHTWHHSDRQLFTITRLGVSAVVPGYDSDMPGFAGILSDDEIVAVLAYIKSTWPDSERDFQAEVTANDQGGS